MMMKWYTFDVENLANEIELVGEFPVVKNVFGDSLCPICFGETELCEGQIDQLPNGTDINGWWWSCWHCHINTETQEGSFWGRQDG